VNNHVSCSDAVANHGRGLQSVQNTDVTGWGLNTRSYVWVKVRALPEVNDFIKFFFNVAVNIDGFVKSHFLLAQ